MALSRGQFTNVISKGNQMKQILRDQGVYRKKNYSTRKIEKIKVMVHKKEVSVIERKMRIRREYQGNNEKTCQKNQAGPESLQ